MRSTRMWGIPTVSTERLPIGVVIPMGHAAPFGGACRYAALHYFIECNKGSTAIFPVVITEYHSPTRGALITDGTLPRPHLE